MTRSVQPTARCSRIAVIPVDAQLAAYLTSTFILAITPGATTAVVVRNALARGTRGGLIAACGAATGNTLQATIAALGVTVLLERWPVAGDVVRLAGGAFLMWLGGKSLWRAAARREPRGAVASRANGTASGFRQGLFVNLLNPSITSFYVSVVPAFIPTDAPRWYYWPLASAHIVIAFACHTGWSLAFGRLGRAASHPAVARGLEVIAGLVLLGLAVTVFTSRP